MCNPESPNKKVEKVFSDDGQLIAEAEFDASGKLHGIERHWNLAGQKILEASYKHGLHDGQYQSWWDSGQLKEDGTYKDGQRVSVYTWYSIDGEKISEHNYGED